MIALGLARRELRGGLRGARAALAGLAIGIAAIAGVGSLAHAIADSLDREARAILGGDVELTLRHRPADGAERAYLEAAGALSTAIEMRSMARAGGKHALVELKAVDGAYPLYGAIRLSPAMGLAQALAGGDGVPGAVAERSVFARLGLALGDRVRVGEAEFVLKATLEAEPDRAGGPFALGPRLMIGADALDATALIQPGSLAEYRYRVRLGEDADAGAWIAATRSVFPEAGWRMRGLADAAPQIKEIVGRLEVYLTLVGLSALLIGGLGIASAVSSYLGRRAGTIATLKCLGATHGLILRVYLLQVAALAGLGIVAGLAAGAALPFALAPLAAATLSVPIHVSLHPPALALAAGFGALVTLVFAIRPLAATRAVAPAMLFRALGVPPTGPRGLGPAAAVASAVIALVAFAAAFAGDTRLALWFAAAALAAFALFRLAGLGIARLAAMLARDPRIGRGRPALRLALANLDRPGAATASVVLSLGLGLTVLVAVASVEANLAREVEREMPARAPAFFFIDIQPHQVAGFESTAAAVPGLERIELAPHLRGRIVRIKGVPVEEAAVAPEARWVVRGDRGITFAAEPPAGATIEAGQWWAADYRGAPLLSFDAEAAKGLGVGVGDTLTLNVLGRDVEARIANLRRIAWQTLGLNFTVILSPGEIEAAPHTYVAATTVTAEAEAALEDAVVSRFANVSAVRVRAALETAAAVLGHVARALDAAAAATLAVGVLVLGSAVAAERRRRLYDSVVLKVLGATRRDIFVIYAIEYGALGILTAILAACAGSAAAYGVLVGIMHASWAPTPLAVAATAIPGAVLVLAAGFWSSWRTLARPAAPYLRNE